MRGTLTALGASSLAVKESSSTSVTVRVTSSTTYTSVTAGRLADLKVGDHITASGASTSGAVSVIINGSLPGPGAAHPTGTPATARRTTSAGNPTRPMGAMAATSGTISAINGTSITLSVAGGGSRAITTSASTKVYVATATSRSALKIGQSVSVQGSTASSGIVTATSVTIGSVALGGPPAGGPGGPGGATGAGPGAAGGAQRPPAGGGDGWSAAA